MKNKDKVRLAHNQIIEWQKVNKPIKWIANELKVNFAAIKVVYPEYTGKVKTTYTKECVCCNKKFTNNFINSKFCSSSCAAKFNNKLKLRKKWTKEQKQKIKEVRSQLR